MLVAVAPYAFLQLDLSAFQLGLVYGAAGVGALGGAVTATANTIRLVPYINGTAVVGNTDGGKTVTEWRCGPAGTNPLPAKYLPGSCKNAG